MLQSAFRTVACGSVKLPNIRGPGTEVADRRCGCRVRGRIVYFGLYVKGKTTAFELQQPQKRSEQTLLEQPLSVFCLLANKERRPAFASLLFVLSIVVFLGVRTSADYQDRPRPPPPPPPRLPPRPPPPPPRSVRGRASLTLRARPFNS